MAADDQPTPVIPPPVSEDPLTAPDPLEIAAWRLALDLEPGAALPDLAAHALARGLDSPSLRQLAGVRRDDVWTIDRLWVDAVAELGIPVLQPPAARRLLIRAVAKDIVAGRVPPLWGTGDIVALIDHDAPADRASSLIEGLFYQDEETPEERPAIERRIRAAAADLLSRGHTG